MKKTALVTLLIALLGIFTLSACFAEAESTAEAAPATLLDRALLVAEDRDQLIILTEDDLLDLIGIEYEDYTDFAYLVALDALTGRELIALQAADEEAAARIVELLQGYLAQRLHETQNYLPDVYRLLSKAEVKQNDLLIVLSLAAPVEGEDDLLLSGEEMLLTEE